jgi:streptogramin lyase
VTPSRADTAGAPAAPDGRTDDSLDRTDDLGPRDQPVAGSAIATAQPEAITSSPGADFFRWWVLLPAPAALAQLGSVVLGGGPLFGNPLLTVAALACLPAQALAWMWSSVAWRRYRDWRLLGSLGLAVVAIVSMVAGLAGELRANGDRAYHVGIEPTDAVELAGEVWISDVEEGAVHRLTEEEGVATAPVAVPGAFELASDGTSLWVSQHDWDDPSAGAVTQLDRNGAVLQRVELPAAPGDIAASDGWVWMTLPEAGSVARLAIATNELVTWPVGRSPASLAMDATGGVWVTDLADSTVRRLDALTGAETDSFDAGSQPVGITVGEGAVWVANAGSDTLTVYDIVHRTPRPLRAPAEPTDLVVHDGVLWIASHDDLLVLALDTHTAEVKHRVDLGDRPLKLEVVEPDLLVTSPDAGLIHLIPLASARN